MRLSRYWSHDQTDVLMKSVKVSMGFTGVWLAESGCFAVVPCQSTDLNWIMHYLEPMRWLWLKIDFTALFHPIIRFIFLLSFSFLLSEISSCLWAFLVTLFPPLACTRTCIPTSQKNVEKFPSSRAPSFQRGRKMSVSSGILFPPVHLFPSFQFLSQTRIPQSSVSLLTVTATSEYISIAAACWWGKLSLRPSFSGHCVSTMVPGLNTNRHVLMSIFSVVKRMIISN